MRTLRLCAAAALVLTGCASLSARPAGSLPTLAVRVTTQASCPIRVAVRQEGVILRTLAADAAGPRTYRVPIRVNPSVAPIAFVVSGTGCPFGAYVMELRDALEGDAPELGMVLLVISNMPAHSTISRAP